MTSLTDFVSKLMDDVNKECAEQIDSSLHTRIHPEINFLLNSLNLLVGQCGSGKTYNVFRETIKLGKLKGNPYTQFIYVTNKRNDETFLRMRKYFGIKTLIVDYNDALECLTNLFEWKELYQWVIDEKQENDLDPQCLEEMFEMLCVNDFSQRNIHTLVLFDDAKNIFKNKKNSELQRLLLENRHPKVTYFICIQDPKGIDTEIQANLNGFWLFGGYPLLKIEYVLDHISSPLSKQELWSLYRQLSKQEALLIITGDDFQEIKIINAKGKIVYEV